VPVLGPELRAAPMTTLACGRHALDLTRARVMGILNVTPDSFSGDGLLERGGELVVAATALAERMAADGADLLDVGGESTRPGHAPVDAATEADRVVPVIRAVRAALPDLPISVDTTKASVAEAAIDAGADLVNDLERAIERALGAGVAWERILVDPGFGFGKTPAQNLVLLRELPLLRVLRRPILLGTSRKSTLGKILDLPPGERLEATLATTALAVAAGVDLVRVHDVAPNVRVTRVADAIVRGRHPLEAEGAG
jgi:dihydropteroate synthase